MSPSGDRRSSRKKILFTRQTNTSNFTMSNKRLLKLLIFLLNDKEHTDTQTIQENKRKKTKLHTSAKAYVQESQVAMTLEDQSRNLIHKC